MFHVELRKFPHTACSFNLSETELHAIVEPWSREHWIEFGERKWNPQEARLTVLEGPHLDVGDLAMGRGWRNAEHKSEDVTARVIAQVRASQQAAAAAQGAAGAAQSQPQPQAQSQPQSGPAAGAAPATAATVEAQLQPLLGADPATLLQAWRLAAQRRPELSPSESLALAERTLGALDAGAS